VFSGRLPAGSGLFFVALWIGGISISARAEICGDPERFSELRAEALSLEHGEGVQRDVERAAQLYCEAARSGDAESQYRLGWIYANGRGVQRDDALASYFFALSARQGNVDAARMLRHVGAEVALVPPCMIAEEPVAVSDDDIVLENLTPAQQNVIELVRRLAPQFGVSPRLAMAVIRAESNFDPLAVSNKNAQGLMQLIPDTATRFNVKKPFDPEQNVRGGLAYLRWLLAYFKGNVALVAAAYNAGEGAVNKFHGIPPFAETRGYVKRIRELFSVEDHPYDASVVDPSPELPRIRVRMM
jgi:TPR repeat protein